MQPGLTFFAGLMVCCKLGSIQKVQAQKGSRSNPVKWWHLALVFLYRHNRAAPAASQKLEQRSPE